MFADAKSYATADNAIKALDKVLPLIGRTRETVNHMIIVQADGRFSPVVYARQHEIAELVGLVHKGICVVG